MLFSKNYYNILLISLVKETRPVLTDDRCSFDRQQYPSMDYTGLYKALGKIVDVVPVVEIGVEGTRNLKKSHLGWKYKKFFHTCCLF